MDMADTLAVIAARDPEVVAAVAREMTHPDPARRRQASETMGYGAVVDTALDALEDAGLLRDGRMRASYTRMLLDMVAGALVRVGGDFPMDRLRTELHRNVDVFLDGATSSR
jgi:hypothetical protein